MDVLPVLCIVAAALTGLTKGVGVLPDGPLNASVGGSVMFTTTLTPPERPFTTMGWKFGNDIDIITFNVLNITAPEYEGRITLFVATASLELRNLTLHDDGEYRVSVTPYGQPLEDGRTTLKVHVPVSNVTVTPSSTDLVEFSSSSVRLSCSSSGSSLSFLWLNSSSEVTDQTDRVQLTDGGSTLTVVNVTRYDRGPFRCHVFNPVSNNTSDPVNLSISFGPENINLTSQEYYVEGSNISLSCSADSRPSAQLNWFLNGDLLPDTGPELRLVNIQEDQSGNYSCQAFNNRTERAQMSQSAHVTVLRRVANVVVTLNSTDLVEFSSSSVRLSCSSSGSSLSFLWLNSSSEVTDQTDRVQLTDGGSTLTVVNVTRYDRGPFRCHVFNPVSNNTSDPVTLSISYGPENINLMISPSQEYFEKGSNISLICSAVSSPSAQFYWFLNGDLLYGPDAGPEFRLMNIQISHSGNHSCQAFNNKTLRNETSQLSVVSVLERISGASVTPSANLLIERNSVNLTCDATGSVFTRKWSKDGSDLNPADNVLLYDSNRVLSFKSLNKKDSGEYTCKISNPVSAEAAPYNMVVNYGPEKVEISGPSEIHLKQTFTLHCSAESTPSAHYTWILNGKEIHNSDVFTKNNAGLSDLGDYTCRAMNAITGRTSSAVHGLSETVASSCSSGCIAAVVITLIAVCGGSVVGGCYLYRKRKYQKEFSNRSTTTRAGGAGQDNSAFSGDPELNYADIRFFQNKDAGTAQLGLENNSAEYAQVQVNNKPAAASSPEERPAPEPAGSGTQDNA